ncbi:MAG: PqqD family protein, partial [Alphaproteobacteria bacterium]
PVYVMPVIDPKTVLWKELNGKDVVLMMESGSFCELNGMGSHIWRLLAQGMDNEQILAELHAAYEVSQEQLVQDVDAFITSMVKQGMLVA